MRQEHDRFIKRSRKGSLARAESLETRRMLAAAYPTPAEQYMVELYNWARLNPAAAAAKHGVGLNEGPPAVTITIDPKQPLAINPQLTSAARSYAQYLIDVDQFSHYADGQEPSARMLAAGYPFYVPFNAGENAGLSSIIGMGNDVSSLNLHFSAMYTDSTIAGRWHRVTMLNPDFKEIGSGTASGMWQGFNAFISVQDLGKSGTGSFLTGVAYSDGSRDNFYTPGEQMAGVTITAIRVTDGATFSTTTWNSGGYSLALPNGEYTVWGGGGGLNGWVRYNNVTIGDQNVKRDFRPDFVGTDPGPMSFARLLGGQVNIYGTSSDDSISVHASDRLYVTFNGISTSFNLSDVFSIWIDGGAGDDTITAWSLGSRGITIDGRSGNDFVSLDIASNATVYGSEGADTIYSGSGHDQLFGGAGDDWVFGSSGYDVIQGDDGNDHLYGSSGFDSLFGGNGDDSLFGQGDNDTLVGGWGADYFVGGSGSDVADYSARTGNLIISLDNRYHPANDGEAGEFDQVLDDIETVLGGSGNDSITGSAAANFLSGGAGNDTLDGGGGFDLLFGGAGNDVILAGDSAWDYIDGGTGADEVLGDAIDVLLNVETFLLYVQPVVAVRPARDPYRPVV